MLSNPIAAGVVKAWTKDEASQFKRSASWRSSSRIRLAAELFSAHNYSAGVSADLYHRAAAFVLRDMYEIPWEGLVKTSSCLQNVCSTESDKAVKSCKNCRSLSRVLLHLKLSASSPYRRMTVLWGLLFKIYPLSGFYGSSHFINRLLHLSWLLESVCPSQNWVVCSSQSYVGGGPRCCLEHY